MKNQTQENTDTVSPVFVMIAGGLMTSALFFLKWFNILHTDLELILAPVVVASLLTYGEGILLYFFINPVCLLLKACSQEKEHSSVNNN